MEPEAQARSEVNRGVRLSSGAGPALTARGLSRSWPSAVDVVLFPVAIEAAGRRSGDAVVLDEPAAAELARVRATGVPLIVALDHAGPAAALWSKDRAVGADDVVEPKTERKCRALDDAEWAALLEKYAAAASLCARFDLPCALVVDDDGLLHRAWSTLGTAREPRPDRIVAVYAACARGVVAAAPAQTSASARSVDVVLPVEDLAPGGLDATDGIELARALVAQGARRIFASAGSSALPALQRREKGGTEGGDSALVLASAAWLVGRIDAVVHAVVPRGDPPTLARHALELGLAGVVVAEAA